jgi:hypothetical protein
MVNLLNAMSDKRRSNTQSAKPSETQKAVILGIKHEVLKLDDSVMEVHELANSFESPLPAVIATLKEMARYSYLKEVKRHGQ